MFIHEILIKCKILGSGVIGGDRQGLPFSGRFVPRNRASVRRPSQPGSIARRRGQIGGFLRLRQALRQGRHPERRIRDHDGVSLLSTVSSRCKVDLLFRYGEDFYKKYAPIFSGPNVKFKGVPTGDARHDNIRIHQENRRRIADIGDESDNSCKIEDEDEDEDSSISAEDTKSLMPLPEEARPTTQARRYPKRGGNQLHIEQSNPTLKSRRIPKKPINVSPPLNPKGEQFSPKVLKVVRRRYYLPWPHKWKTQEVPTSNLENEPFY